MESMRDDIYRAAMKHTKTKVNEQIPAIAQGMANFEIQRLAQELVGHLPPSSEARQLPPARIVESKALVAHTRQQIDPHEVKPRVDSEKKSIEKKESVLEKFHGSIEKVLFKGDKRDSGMADGELESPVDYEEEEEEIIEPDYAEPEPEQEKDLMDMPIDDRWQEYSNVEPPSMKGKGGKKAKKAASRAADQES
jgi:hypothetical protein